MNDKLTLKVLSFIPSDKWIEEDQIKVDRVHDVLWMLYEGRLVHRQSNPRAEPTSMRYRRSITGSDWIREYRRRKRNDALNYCLCGMTLLILILTLALVFRG